MRTTPGRHLVFSPTREAGSAGVHDAGDRGQRGIIVWLRRLDGVAQRTLAMGLTLIMGGALGNVIDRIHRGFVVDFIAAHWKGIIFPRSMSPTAALRSGRGC